MGFCLLCLLSYLWSQRNHQLVLLGSEWGGEMGRRSLNVRTRERGDPGCVSRDVKSLFLSSWWRVTNLFAFVFIFKAALHLPVNTENFWHLSWNIYVMTYTHLGLDISRVLADLSLEPFCFRISQKHHMEWLGEAICSGNWEDTNPYSNPKSKAAQRETIAEWLLW